MIVVAAAPMIAPRTSAHTFTDREGARHNPGLVALTVAVVGSVVGGAIVWSGISTGVGRDGAHGGYGTKIQYHDASPRRRLTHRRDLFRRSVNEG